MFTHICFRISTNHRLSFQRPRRMGKIRIVQVEIPYLQNIEVPFNGNFPGGGTVATFQSCALLLDRIAMNHCA